MSNPVWIDCATIAELPSVAQLAEKASGDRHVVLRFPLLRQEEMNELISRLRDALPDHTVFNISGGLAPASVTVMPVVSRVRVLERRNDILQAILDYRVACAELMSQYRSGSLSSEWQTAEHGWHCCFKNGRTGQLVEAPLECHAHPEQVDPYFFSMFVRSTVGLETVAELLKDSFHDAARILEILEGDHRNR